MKCLRWIAIALWPGRVQWNPVNTVTNGPKHFGLNNWVTVFQVFLYKKMYGRFCQAAKNKWP